MIGQKLGPYRVLERIGEGGMGVVYRAHDERLDRDVALKVLPARAVPDEAARARLFREARTASALNHPNICTIHEVAESEGHPYIAMEFIEGRRLADLLPDEGVSSDQAARYGSQIADALEHAHRRGVIHRDLKSANVMITPESRVKVLDFGLAVRYTGPMADVTRSSDSLSNYSVVAGTLPYLAPEVLRGLPADARSDIWSLGIILWEMSTGHLPFEGGTGYELSSSILRDALPPVPSHLPPLLPAVIQRCLSKDPGQRFQNAGEVRAALETVQMGSAVLPRELVAPPPPRVSRRVWLGLGVAVLVGAALLVGLNVGGLRDTIFFSGAVRSVAVAPFEDLAGVPEQAYFAAGMTEAITTELSRFSGLEVVSLRDVGRGAEAPIEVARKAGVDMMLRGSVLRAGERVQIYVQLVETRAARTVWAKRYDQTLRDVLTTHSEVALALAQELSLVLPPRQATRLARAKKVDPQAYEAYLLGLHHWNRRTRADSLRARDYFLQVLEKDPNYAPAYVGLADVYLILHAYGEVPAEEAHPKIREAALRALDLDPELGEAHASLGNLAATLYDWQQAEAAFRRAIQLRPSYATAHHWYALMLAALGRDEEALASLRSAERFDPQSPIIRSNVAWCHYLAGRYDRAAAQVRGVLRDHPDFTVAHGYLGQALLELGRHAEALQAMERAVEISQGSPAYLAELGNALAVTGNRPRALEILKSLEERAKEQFVSPYAFAMVYAGLGQDEQAIVWLEKSAELSDPRIVNVRAHPRFRHLHGHPRFRALLAKMGLDLPAGRD